ncbi:unnamed protein product [Toxocara canis]|uniref:Tudor domain-containing protein n=1 Tax=Toxocara canis TaxID=6265 RepID=A0A183UHH2_TOXCA|nr:unnamed protein product [Toxocara canis]
MEHFESKATKQRSFRIHLNNLAYQRLLIEQIANGGLRHVEVKYGARFRCVGKAIEVETDEEHIGIINDELNKAWQVADFSWACEMNMLTEISDYRLFFTVSPVESVTLQMNKNKLLLDEQLIDVKLISCRIMPMGRFFDSVARLYYQDNNAPYVMTMRVPEECIHLFMGKSERWLEETLKCLVDVRLVDANHDYIPVDIITNRLINLVDVNKALADLADRCHISNRDWMHFVELRCGSASIRVVTDGSFLLAGKLEEAHCDGLRLLFSAPLKRVREMTVNDAAVVKLIEDINSCTFKFFGNMDYSGYCLVEISARNVGDLNEARSNIESLIKGTWRGASSCISTSESPFVTNREEASHSGSERNRPSNGDFPACRHVYFSFRGRSSKIGARSEYETRKNAHKGMLAGRTKPIKMLALKASYAAANIRKASC